MNKKSLFWTGLLISILIGISIAVPSAAAQEPTPTDDGEINLPTATPTQPGGPTPTPSRTPQPERVMAFFPSGPINLRSSPYIDWENIDVGVVAEVSAGIRLPIEGRWLGYNWYLVAWEDAPEGSAWVFGDLIIIEGDESAIPVVEPPPPPTEPPTATEPLSEEQLRGTQDVLQTTPGGVETATAEAFEFEATLVASVTPGPDGVAEAPENPNATFTPPPDGTVRQIDQFPAVEPPSSGVGPPPAAIILVLGMFGGFTLTVGIVRRFF